MRVLSVDLGTSNTVAVLSAHGRPPRVVEVDGSATMPSAVYAGEDGNLLVGRDAERRARLEPSRFEPNPKRRVDEGSLLLGDTVVPVNEAMAAVLRRVLDETSRQLGGAVPDEVRLTHPAQWGQVRRNVLLGAARLAGVRGNLMLVPEPVAAAAHFASFPGQSLSPGQALAVYDLGAGTFDIAVVGATQNGFTVLAEDGLPDLGGLDVDQALMEHVGRQVSHRDPGQWQRLLRPETTADRRAQRALREDVRAAKEALSRHPQTEVPMPEPFEDVLVTRAELEALVRPNLLRSVELLAATIASARLTPDQLVGIYLVGGSSRIPLVATLIAEGLRVVPTSLDQPETAVALGAHHVPHAGSASPAPSQNPTGTPLGDQPTATMAPVSGGFPQQPGGGYPRTGGIPAFPASGQQPVLPHPGGPRHHGYAPPQQGAPPVTSPKPRRQPLLVAATAAVVVALAVVAWVFLLPGNGMPSATDCQQQGQPDDKGFTQCTRQLAGSVPGKSQCQAGDSSAGALTSCALADGYQVHYLHAKSLDEATAQARTVLETSPGDRVEADWAGNGLKGRYSATVSAGAGVVVFTVPDRPVVGWMTTDKAATADALADYFQNAVQPGE